jgi:hypothetical protein
VTDRIDTIVAAMAAGALSPTVQVTQTRFRVGLVDGWRIPALRMVADEARLAMLPGALRDLVTSQADVLRAVALDRGNEPLASCSVTADQA